MNPQKNWLIKVSEFPAVWKGSVLRFVNFFVLYLFPNSYNAVRGEVTVFITYKLIHYFLALEDII